MKNMKENKENKKFSKLLEITEIIELDNNYNRDYPDNVKNSMYDYSEDSNIVNDCLRNHNGIWNSELESKYGMNRTQFNNMVKDLDNNQIKLIEDATLYRGFNKPSSRFEIGQEIPDRGYVSTSFDKGVSRYYAGEKGTILQIDVFKGTKGVYIRQHSSRPEELEFLLPRGTKLVVYDKKGNYVYCKLKYL